MTERLGNRCKCRQQLNAAALATAAAAHDTLAQTVIHIHATTGMAAAAATYVPWCARVRIRCVHLSSLPLPSYGSLSWRAGRRRLDLRNLRLPRVHLCFECYDDEATSD